MDDSQLIKNQADLFSTSRVACLVADEQLHNMILGSPGTKNLLWRIYHEKTLLKPEMTKERAIIKGERCLIPRSIQLLEFFKSFVFFVCPATAANLVQASLFLFKQQAISLWINEKVLVEFNMVICFSLRQPDNKRRIGRS